jgi:hypothetical protein
MITESCTHCHYTLSKGRLARVWENRFFCNEYCQASWMLMKGYALQRPAPKKYKSEYNHCIFKGQPMITYKGCRFCDFEEWVQYVREHLGMTEVVGEQIVAL